MTDSKIKSIYQHAPRMAAGASGSAQDIDTDRIARIASGEISPVGADIELLGSSADAATAYQVARGLRDEAHALSAALRMTPAAAPRRHPRPGYAWPMALAASVLLMVFFIGGRLPLQDPAGLSVAHSGVTTDAKGELFSGSFEPSSISEPASGVIFGGSFDNS